MSERFKDVSSEELQKKIDERQQFLEKVAAFIAVITPKIGKVTRQGGSDSCSETDWEVINFEGFSFEFKTGWSDQYAVYHHPKMLDLDFAEPAGREKKYEVRIFNEDPGWQDALLNAIEHRDEILDQRKKAEEERQAELRLKSEEERKRAQLIEEAERLKL